MPYIADLLPWLCLLLQFWLELLCQEGASLGLALQCGSRKDLEDKLKVLTDYEKKGFKFEGTTLGFALRSGSHKDLKAKLDILAY